MGRQNLWASSDALDNATFWTAINCVATGNLGLDPDGKRTLAGLVASSTASALHRIAQTEPTVKTGTSATVSFVVAPGAVSWCEIVLNNQSGFAYFNLSGAGQALPQGATIFANIRQLPCGSYLCSVTTTARLLTAASAYIASANGNNGSTYAAADTTTPQIYASRAQYVNANWEGERTITTTTPVGLTTPPRNLVQPALENLLPNADDFSAATWQKQSGTTVNPNQVVAPDGTLTADLIDFTATTVGQGIFSPFVVVGGKNNCKSVWLRGVLGGEVVTLVDPVNGLGAVTCTLTTQWKRFVSTAATGANPTSAGLEIAKSSGSQIYAWRAQLVIANWEGESVTTTAAAVGALTPPRNLVQPIRQNLFVQANTFDNASWTKTSCTIAPNASTDPDGNLVADGIVATSTANVQHVVGQAEPSMPIGSNATVSFVVKPGAVSWCVLSMDNTFGQVYFNLTGAGVVGSNQFGFGTGKIRLLPNGNYLCSIVDVRAHLSSSTARMGPASGDLSNSYAAADTTTPQIYVCRASYVQANWEGEFVETTVAQSGIATPPRNLVQTTLQNYAIQATAMANSAWAASASGVTPLGGQPGAPDTSSNAASLTFAATTSFTSQIVSTAVRPGQVWAFSTWVWSPSGKATIAVRINSSVGEQAFVTIPLTPTPTRVAVTLHIATTATNLQFGFDNRVAEGGDGVAGTVFAWGGQLVQSNQAGEFVNTIAAPVGLLMPPRNAIPAGQNILLQANDMTTSWTATRITPTADQIMSPITGLVTMDLISDDTDVTPLAHFLQQALTTIPGQVYCLSCVVKDNGTQWIALAPNGGGDAGYIDILNGVKGAGVGAHYIDHNIESIAGWAGYYRVWISYVSTGTAAELFTASANGTTSYQGASARKLWIGHVQVNEGPTPGPITATLGTKVDNGPTRRAA